jgi:hypothetical protein
MTVLESGMLEKIDYGDLRGKEFVKIGRSYLPLYKIDGIKLTS